MYVSRTVSVYESVREDIDARRPESSLHVVYSSPNLLSISWNDRHLSDHGRWADWCGVEVCTQDPDHHHVFVECILGRMPYAVFADWLEEHKEHLLPTEARPGDWAKMLDKLRNWEKES